MQPVAEKSQPWKASWLARNANATSKAKVAGTTHGFAKGKEVVLSGHTSGVPIVANPEDQN
ncbi:hypothetical protein L13192_07128 [Pyrenophora tritici-repentis]|nr:hypothetical protein L13192_07128 [Pyrenophora tritici-repentis]